MGLNPLWFNDFSAHPGCKGDFVPAVLRPQYGTQC